MPLADVIKKIMQVSQNEMGRPVEIEFAVNLDYNKNKQHSFYLLQIRPIVDTKEFINENLDAIQSTEAIITSNNALGHGILSDIYDIVYVRPEVFKAANSEQIASAINAVNKQLMDENRNYILIGPGRWGSSDPWLGIPVKWSGICNARLIVESGLSNYRIDPSQGTHFFQNLTSLGVAYYTINPFRNDGTYDVEFLNSKPAQFENEYIRHVRFHNALIVKTDGRKNLGVVLKP